MSPQSKLCPAAGEMTGSRGSYKTGLSGGGGPCRGLRVVAMAAADEAWRRWINILDGDFWLAAEAGPLGPAKDRLLRTGD